MLLQISPERVDGEFLLRERVVVEIVSFRIVAVVPQLLPQELLIRVMNGESGERQEFSGGDRDKCGRRDAVKTNQQSIGDFIVVCSADAVQKQIGEQQSDEESRGQSARPDLPSPAFHFEEELFPGFCWRCVSDGDFDASRFSVTKLHCGCVLANEEGTAVSLTRPPDPERGFSREAVIFQRWDGVAIAPDSVDVAEFGQESIVNGLEVVETSEDIDDESAETGEETQATEGEFQVSDLESAFE